MKKVLVLIIVAMACVRAEAQDTKIFLKKAPQPIVADGSVSDWGEKPFVLYNVDTKLKYGFAYDDKYLYLCYQSEDRMNQMKIMQAGMSLSLTVKASKKATVGISYPLKKTVSSDTLRMLMGGGGGSARMRDSVRPGRMQPQRLDTTSSQLSRIPAQDANLTHNSQMQHTEAAAPRDTTRNPRERSMMDAKRMRDMFLSMQTTMELSGFVQKNGTQPIHNADGVNVQINWDSAGAMIYEIAIPFTEIFDNPNFSPASIKEVVLETTLNVPEIPEGFRQMQFRMGDGGGMPGGGDGGNAPRGGGGGNRGNFDPTTYFAPATSKHTINMPK